MMDWGIIYQATFFLAIAMLVILITIFVFSSSLLGRAIERASQEQKKLKEEQEQSYNQRIKQAEEELEKAKKTGEPEKAREALSDLVKEKEEFEKKSKAIEKGYLVFTTTGGIVYPGLLLILSLILSSVAWGFSGGAWQWLTFYLWGAAILAMGWGGYRLYFSLKKIEEIAITSEVAALKREAEAFELALTEHEEKRRPKLALLFTDEQPPFHIKSGAETTIAFSIFLMQGDVAREPRVHFLAPPGFDFPGSETWLQSQRKEPVGGYITTRSEDKDFGKGVTTEENITIKAPSKTGKFTLYYRLSCEGFDSDYKEFEVIVD